MPTAGVPQTGRLYTVGRLHVDSPNTARTGTFRRHCIRHGDLLQESPYLEPPWPRNSGTVESNMKTRLKSNVKLKPAAGRDTSVRERAYLHIQQLVATGQVAAGSALSELQLAKETGQQPDAGP